MASLMLNFMAIIMRILMPMIKLMIISMSMYIVLIINKTNDYAHIYMSMHEDCA